MFSAGASTSQTTQRARFTLDNPPATNLDYKFCYKCFSSANPSATLNCSSNIPVVGGKATHNQTLQKSCDFRWKWSTASGLYETPGTNNERRLTFTNCAQSQALNINTRWAQYVSGTPDVSSCQSGKFHSRLLHFHILIDPPIPRPLSHARVHTRISVCAYFTT